MHVCTHFADIKINGHENRVHCVCVCNAGCSTASMEGTIISIRIQWGLFIKDTLGPANLSTVERLSTLQRWKMY